jgi:hypothetical protein
LGWAAFLLVTPSSALSLLGGQPDATSRSVARILGARHVLQAMVELTSWPRWRRIGSLVDATHAATALALAIADQRWRRPAGADAVIAATLAVTATRSSPDPLGQWPAAGRY